MAVLGWHLPKAPIWRS